MRSRTRGLSRYLMVVIILASGMTMGFQSAYVSREFDPPLFINLDFPSAITIPSNFPEPQGEFTSMAIPLKRAGRLLLIEAVVDGIEGNLIFDTGAIGLVLNRTYFRNRVLMEGEHSMGITGSAGNLGCVIAEKLQIGDLYYENVKADVSELGHIENRRGIKVIGLFGFGMIRELETVIDVAHNELYLYRIDRRGERVAETESSLKPDRIQKIDPWYPVLVLKGKVGGKSLSFCLDTGAKTNAITIHAPKDALNTIQITRRSDLQGAGNGKSEVLYGTMNDFQFEGYPMKGMETIIVNLDPLNEAYGTKIDGMLGFNFLEQGIVTINLVKKQFGIRYHNTNES